MCEDKKRLRIWAGFILAMLLATAPVMADSVYNPGAGSYTGQFTPISNNSGQAWALSNQFSVFVELEDSGDHAGMASFTFFNNGPIDSNIAEIYWDWTDPTALDPNATNDSFDFYDSENETWDLDGTLEGGGQQGVDPRNLPGGSNIQFVASAGADGDNAGITNDPLDFATFYMALKPGKVWTDLYDELFSGSIRFGMHVRSIGYSGNSDSFYSPFDPEDPDNPPPPPLDNVVPLPGAAGLGLLGMGLVAVFRRKKLAE